MHVLGRRVLIADHHDLVRKGVMALAEGRSELQIVAEAASGPAALEAARRTEPNVAIIDLSLPELNGVELTLALKRQMPEIEVLIYTASEGEDVIHDVLRAGARGYVLKSETEDTLLAAIDALSAHRLYFSSIVTEMLLKRYLANAPFRPASLSSREREVVQLIAEGHSNKIIAHKLDISIKTVETHRAAAMDKLKLGNTADLVRYAVRNAIIEA